MRWVQSGPGFDLSKPGPDGNIKFNVASESRSAQNFPENICKVLPA
jgi:hypothetical protein